jgi:hypothetical protein
MFRKMVLEMRIPFDVVFKSCVLDSPCITDTYQLLYLLHCIKSVFGMSSGVSLKRLLSSDKHRVHKGKYFKYVLGNANLVFVCRIDNCCVGGFASCEQTNRVTRIGSYTDIPKKIDEKAFLFNLTHRRMLR